MIMFDGINNFNIESDEPVVFICNGKEIKLDFDDKNCYIMIGNKKYKVDFNDNKIIEVDQ